MTDTPSDERSITAHVLDAHLRPIRRFGAAAAIIAPPVALLVVSGVIQASGLLGPLIRREVVGPGGATVTISHYGPASLILAGLSILALVLTAAAAVQWFRFAAGDANAATPRLIPNGRAFAQLGRWISLGLMVAALSYAIVLVLSPLVFLLVPFELQPDGGGGGIRALVPGHGAAAPGLVPAQIGSVSVVAIWASGAGLLFALLLGAIIVALTGLLLAKHTMMLAVSAIEPPDRVAAAKAAWAGPGSFGYLAGLCAVTWPVMTVTAALQLAATHIAVSPMIAGTLGNAIAIYGFLVTAGFIASVYRDRHADRMPTLVR